MLPSRELGFTLNEFLCGYCYHLSLCLIQRRRVLYPIASTAVKGDPTFSGKNLGDFFRFLSYLKVLN